MKYGAISYRSWDHFMENLQSSKYMVLIMSKLHVIEINCTPNRRMFQTKL